MWVVCCFRRKLWAPRALRESSGAAGCRAVSVAVGSAGCHRSVCTSRRGPAWNHCLAFPWLKRSERNPTSAGTAGVHNRHRCGLQHGEGCSITCCFPTCVSACSGCVLVGVKCHECQEMLLLGLLGLYILG